ncbi:unnamed protein product [Didymodactylos carnosus]|uniref:Methyltransferase domain-containing protein n=1 Tax=Didymodactylos carnosus TaxID=1234261 RepID=A0A815Z710_9BILA|nr:unnamed protein product [Didymodactylos carnosus]CAF4448507.1 unnamed protein product [Didymodactylos carnosus]
MTTDDDQTLISAWLEEESRWREKFQGWDFSQLTKTGRILFNMSEEQLGWDYTQVVCQTLAEIAGEIINREILLLDLGTGGGEFLEAMLPKLYESIDRSENKWGLKVYATESYKTNFQLAKQRLISYGVTVIESEPDSLNSLLPFSNDHDPNFDLIISRHTCYNTREIDRLLKPGTGYFITQQVDGASNQDLIELFPGHKPRWPYYTLGYATYIFKHQAPRMKLLRAEESETKLQFNDMGALIVYLHAVPWLVEDFTVQKYRDVLLNLYRSGEKLKFKSKYMLLKAVKLSNK